MRKIFEFGEQIDAYDIPVLNERAVRASAGILFLIAIIAFMNAWLTGNFQPTRVFVVAFLLDFGIRIFINPRYAPSLIVGQWVVRKQQAEYVGAPQKRFVWAIGFVLALTMFYLVVINKMIGPVNLIVCATCLTLLFYEAAFGICLGCKIYSLFNKEKARLCPGSSCETTSAKSEPASVVQIVMVVVFALVISTVAHLSDSTSTQNMKQIQPLDTAASVAAIDPAEAERCKVPDFAKAMRHEDKWKLHNNCK